MMTTIIKVINERGKIKKEMMIKKRIIKIRIIMLRSTPKIRKKEQTAKRRYSNRKTKSEK